MKKFVSALLALTMVFALAACGNANAQPEAPVAQPLTGTMEELVNKGVSTADKDERYQTYTELWKMVMDTKTILPVLHKGVGIAWSSNIVVPGLCPSYYHIDQWTWAA